MDVTAIKDLYYKWYLEIFSELKSEIVEDSNLKEFSSIAS